MMVNMIFMVFIFGFLHLPGMKGASTTNSVLQTPSFIIKRTGESVARGINCSHSITYYDNILWYKQQQGALKLLGYLNVKILNLEKDVKGKISFDGEGDKHSSLTISNLTINDSGVYFCAASRDRETGEAYFGQGTKLTVLEVGKEITGPTVKVLQPSPKECKNEKDQIRKKTLVCVATEFYPDHVSVYWQISGENITDGVATDEAAQWIPGEKFYQITSRLRVPAEEWENSDNKFQCIVNFFNGSATVPYSDSIYGEASTTANKMTREKYLKITQTAKLTYGVFIAKSCIYGAFVLFLVWKLQGSKGKQKY